MFDELALDLDDRVPIMEGVPYMAEGRVVIDVINNRFGDGGEMVITKGREHQCLSHHDWSEVPEGKVPSYVCWNCDAVKFPAEVLKND